jgi:uncharacterized protein YegL
MLNSVTPMELYHAAREVCMRLYVVNGGDPLAKWIVRPFPGTAAISCNRPYYGAPTWTLGMPSFPLNVRLPRWKSDLIAAYTIHELLHALWTDFDVVKQSHVEGLHGLCNALEDNRIEAKASAGALVQVSEARRLLSALNAHIARRAINTPQFTLDAPEQFSFVLGLVIFAEKLGYVSELPIDWRARVRPEWFPLFDLALARFDALTSTADVLQLARDLKALAASLPKPRKPRMNRPRPMPQAPQGDDEGLSSMPREREIVEPENDPMDVPPMPVPQAPQKPTDEPKSEDEHRDGNEDKPASVPAPAPAEGKPSEDEAKPSEDGAGASDEDGKETRANEGGGSDRGGRNSNGALPADEDENEPAEDVTDKTQTYAEANLNDLADEARIESGTSHMQLSRDMKNVETILNVEPLKDLALERGGNPKLAGAAISAPAKLRRHLTLAVKSPERVGNERKQVSGRLDMRNLAGIAMGAPTVFRRRTEDEGKEAVVTLLMDISGSMKGQRLAAAKALAIHMGDALKAAGVRFEICAFDDNYLATPKPLAKGWAVDTQRAVAGLRTMNGTAMLPAMKQCAERLVRVGNVTRRILLVLTDGQDSFDPQADAALCAYYKTRGVEIVGIGLMTYGMSATFNGNAITVNNCNELSTLGLSALVKTLDKGAPRVA